MPRNDVFAMKNSGLEPFLFAEVGTEPNGSSLTILSMLARLGKDPWAQAEAWMNSTGSNKVDDLAQSIAKMPLSPRALAEAYATAGRLLLLLPRHAGAAIPAAGRMVAGAKLPQWAPLAAFAVALGLLVATGAFVASPSAPAIPPNPAAVATTIGAGQ